MELFKEENYKEIYTHMFYTWENITTDESFILPVFDALSKQIGKRHYFLNGRCYCGSCRKPINRSELYCKECGQKINWGEE